MLDWISLLSILFWLSWTIAEVSILDCLPDILATNIETATAALVANLLKSYFIFFTVKTFLFSSFVIASSFFPFINWLIAAFISSTLTYSPFGKSRPFLPKKSVPAFFDSSPIEMFLASWFLIFSFFEISIFWLILPTIFSKSSLDNSFPFNFILFDSNLLIIPKNSSLLTNFP